ncbi:MAG: hypothetical protein PHG27_01065 [Massilibacteroides sp.]|nr:hypothetical protein [Massilibacteroides sp.]MDD3063047.1 hypothetical protein [Massilibacteroides sp.]MDD4114176.1 hypothetical protein [Massilibacteroides sp.]MDD4660556.1 hypothetical protein [Massilibacteroides sp.]
MIKKILNAKTNANFMKSLEGTVTGLQVYTASGQPGGICQHDHPG